MAKEEDWTTNRHRKRKPKRGLFWCYYCDTKLVGEGQKCPICKHRNKIKRDKK